MKWMIIDIIIIGAAIGLAFLLDKLCKPAELKSSVWVLYIVSQFVYHICWAALSYLEKHKPTFISIVFSNIGFFLLFTATTIAFINIAWWIVLLCLPVIWFIGGYVGGWLARHVSFVYIYPIIATFFLSVMFHCYYQ